MNLNSRLRPARLVLVGLFAVAFSGLLPSALAGWEAGRAPSTTEERAIAVLSDSPGNPFTEEAGGQAPACGGLGQRACCFLERFPLPSCDGGLREAPLGQFPTACGGSGAGTCMPVSPVTACGGEGQRACCVFEGQACQEGLVERGDDLALDFFVPVSGDATCSDNVIVGSSVPRSQGTCIKVPHDPIDDPAAGWTATPEPRGVLRGYLDMHLHLLGDMAHGGKNLVGEPAPRDGTGQFVLDSSHTINTALSPATDILVHKNPYHGLLNDTSGFGTGDGARSEFGAPYFSGWPKWTSTTHQQAYYVWLERAWRGGLRATTLFASHVSSLCMTSLKLTRNESWPMCDDSMLHIVEQLKVALDFETFVDRISGGPGQGWFRIVRSPQQARDAVRAGKLAVVLGIEVDKLFNCKHTGCPADFGLPAALIAPLGLAQPTTLEEAVNVIYDMGVRQVFPVHNFDNGFGAAATWMDAIAVGQVMAEGRWWETRNCGDGRGDYGFWLDNAGYYIMLLVGFGVTAPPPIPFYSNAEGYASCNEYGLRDPLGPRLMQALMNKGMLIDIDHMSANSLDQTIELTGRGPDGNGEAYPLLASHVQAFDLHQKEFEGNNGRHERMRTRTQLDAIRASGGMVAAMLKDDVQDTGLKGHKFTLPYTPSLGAAIADNCRHSSKSWAQAFQYAVDVMGGPVAMGSDFNGAAGHLGPRFGSDACGGWGAPNGLERPQQIFENSRVEYPFNLLGFGTFDQQVTGFKSFDYNVDGLAHIGLLPDMVADLERIGMNQYYLDQLFCSAEAYIRVWERADALAARRPAPDPNRPWLCNVTDNTPPASSVVLAPPTPASGWHRTDVTATFAATDGDSGVARIDYSLTLDGLSAPGGADGTPVTATLVGQGQGSLTFFATDVAGNVESPSNEVTLWIDRTPPEIEASRTPAANAAGWNNGAVRVDFLCTDVLSGIDTCASPQVLGREGANQSASGEAFDNAGNDASAALSGINIDLTAPVIVGSRTPAATAAGWNNGAVTVSFTCTDPLSGIAECTAPSILISEGAGQSASGDARDEAGNLASAIVSPINIDLTVPVITAARAPSANAEGWNNSPVTVSFACADALSGIASCTAPNTMGSDGAGQSVSGAAVDNAGNAASAGVSDINIDRTAPVVQVTGVVNGGVYDLGAVPQADCSTIDALSGVAAPAVVAVSGGTSNGVGTFTAACTGARDRAGNTNAASAIYAVHYVFVGFAAPVDNPPIVNGVKGGQTVPVKFGLTGDHGLDVLLGGAATSAAMGCTAGATVDPLELMVTNSGASQFAYDPLTGLYQFNWKTEKAWAATCRRLLVRLDDGTVHAADFRLQ